LKSSHLLSYFVLLDELFEFSRQFLIFLPQLEISVMVICHLLLNLSDGGLQVRSDKSAQVKEANSGQIDKLKSDKSTQVK
jgi:hypothetical protein